MIKVGDRVRAIHVDRTWLQKNQVYTVERIEYLRRYVLIEVTGVPRILWALWRFKRYP